MWEFRFTYDGEEGRTFYGGVINEQSYERAAEILMKHMSEFPYPMLDYFRASQVESNLPSR